MKSKIVWVSLLVSVLLVSLSVGIHVVKAESMRQQVSFSSGVTVFSPLNTTYNSRFLTLELTFGAGMGVQCSLKYDIDGKYEGPIPLVANNPAELHVVMMTTGIVKLPELSDGSHRLTVNTECSVDVYGGNAPGAPFKPTTPNGTHFVASWADTVYFTIDSGAPTVDSTPPNNFATDASPPNISNLSLENKTYLTPDVPLNFTVNENTSRVTYCLDGKDNVTITENTTLTGLSIGAHNLTVYAWDDAGNVGASQTIDFAVTNVTSAPLQPSEPFPTALVVAAAGVFVAVVGIGLLVYFRKRNREIPEKKSVKKF